MRNTVWLLINSAGVLMGFTEHITTRCTVLSMSLTDEVTALVAR